MRTFLKSTERYVEKKTTTAFCALERMVKFKEQELKEPAVHKTEAGKYKT